MIHERSRVLGFGASLTGATIVACCLWTTTTFASVMDVNTTIDVQDSDACPGARLSLANRGDETLTEVEVTARFSERATRIEKSVLRPGEIAAFPFEFCRRGAEDFPSGVHPLIIEVRSYDADAQEHVDLRVVPVRVGVPGMAGELKIAAFQIDRDAAIEVRNAGRIARDLEARLIVSPHAGMVGASKRFRLEPGESRRMTIPLDRGLRDLGPAQNGYVIVQWLEQGRVCSEIAQATFSASPIRPGGLRAGAIVAVVLLMLFGLACWFELSPRERAVGWERFKWLIAGRRKLGP
jgi:hypothetical protein